MNNFIKKLGLLIFVLFVLPFSAVMAADVEEPDLDLSVFKGFYEVELPELIVPSVVSVDLMNLQGHGLLILEDSELPQPWDSVKQKIDYLPDSTGHSSLLDNASNLFDGDFKTVAEFDLDQDEGHAYVIAEATRALELASIYLLLDSYVALPDYVQIKAEVGGKWKTLVAKNRMKSHEVFFPVTSAKKWRFDFWHSQPLRLREIEMFDRTNHFSPVTERIYWLARPGATYTLYVDAKAKFEADLSEKPYLLDPETEVVVGDLSEWQQNSLFKEPDVDEDGVIDIFDNCVKVENSDQIDINENDLGDACEDFDKDGKINSLDNCPEHPNARQADEDGDGIGDECDDEESRLTERLPWMPWVVIGLVSMLIAGVLVYTLKKGSN